MFSNKSNTHRDHDHKSKQAIQSEDKYANRLATATAILATFAVVSNHFGSATMMDSLIDKSNAAAIKTETANIWAYYQAKNTQQLILATASELSGYDKEKYQTRINRYEDQKEKLKEEGYRLQDQSKKLDSKAEMLIKINNRWSQSSTVFQLAIAIAAISLLTRKQFLNYALGFISIFGFILSVMALFEI